MADQWSPEEDATPGTVFDELPDEHEDIWKEDSLPADIRRRDAFKAALGRLMPQSTAKLWIGLGIVITIVLFAIIGPYFLPNPRFSGYGEYIRPFTDGHILGTNGVGNDVLAQLATGARGSLVVGLIVGGITILLSLFFGIVGGYMGGWTDETLSLITAIMLVIPGLPLVIVISSYVPGRSLILVGIILGVTGWAGQAVVLRSQARSLRVREYVLAARVAGERPARVIAVELLPNLLPVLAAQFLFAMVGAILAEAGLSFLGLGPSGSITWGTILNEAQGANALRRGAWWWFFSPGILIALFGAGLSLINFSIDEIINPKLRALPKPSRKEKRQARAEARRVRAGSAAK